MKSRSLHINNSSELYSRISRIYDLWIESDPARIPSQQFYVEYVTQLSRVKGDILEAGIGTGRIGLTIAQGGQRVIGVDSCEEMLALCRINALNLGPKVSKKVTLLYGDIKTITVKRPVGVVIMPFRTIGHILGNREKHALFRNIHNILEPGGLFVFDHFVFDPAMAANLAGTSHILQVREDITGQIIISHSSVYSKTDNKLDCCLMMEKIAVGGLQNEKNNTITL